MLAQFQARYPTASLLSQLLTIYQGKFVVQVSVQIEGVVRSTGLAAAETIELAEDRARTRAIALLSDRETTSSAPQKSDYIPSISNLTNNSSNLEPSTPTISPALQEDYPEFAPNSSKDYFSLPELNSDPVEESIEFEPIAPITSNPIASPSKVDAPFVSHSFEDDDPLLDPISVTEPIDLSDTLIAIETELRNLRWTAETERKYLNRIYSKESRDLLTTTQLIEFLNYLQVFAQTSKELARLGWDNQQGQDYLMKNYKKKSRQYLTYQELAEFLEHLQATS
jgi:hypothetical protein